MDIKTIFGLLRHLTSQTNIKDLTLALTELLVANFPGVQVVVYEILGGRTDDTQRNYLVGLDCLQMKQAIFLHENEKLLNCYQSKDELFWTDTQSVNYLAIPVELYDTNVSHLIVASHPYQDGPGLEVLLGLLRIFTDVFRNIHEKGYDPLTRIYNRQAFDQHINHIAYSPRQSNVLKDFNRTYSAIAILDIDHFKKINDRFGHAIGDETLVLFAQTVRSILRHEDMFFRYGGEEFVVFIKKVEQDHTSNILVRCQRTIECKRFPQVGKVTVSAGLAKLLPSEHPSDSLSKADKALYYAKKNGRNQVHSYDYLIEQKLLKPIEIQHGTADFW